MRRPAGRPRASRRSRRRRSSRRRSKKTCPNCPPRPIPKWRVAPREVQKEAPQRLEPRAPRPRHRAAGHSRPGRRHPGCADGGPANLRPSMRCRPGKIEVAALLERNKRYPPMPNRGANRAWSSCSSARPQGGDRQPGRDEFGLAELDQEAIALVRRAHRSRAAAGTGGAHLVDLSVPIRFNLR